MKGKIVKINEDGSLDVELPSGEVRKGFRPPAAIPNAPAGRGKGAGEEGKFFQYELELGGITINEHRAAKGLPPDERFGNMTYPEYIAANVETYATKAAALTGDLAPEPGGENKPDNDEEEPRAPAESEG